MWALLKAVTVLALPNMEGGGGGSHDSPVRGINAYPRSSRSPDMMIIQ
jgi:hypothetical protein